MGFLDILGGIGRGLMGGLSGILGKIPIIGTGINILKGVGDVARQLPGVGNWIGKAMDSPVGKAITNIGQGMSGFKFPGGGG